MAEYCCKCGRKLGAKIKYHQTVSYSAYDKKVGEFVNKIGKLCGPCLYDLLNDPTRFPNEISYYKICGVDGHIFDEEELALECMYIINY